MEHKIIHQLFAPKGEFLEPPQSSKPVTASSYELRPGFIAMVREQTFSGLDYENPYHHLWEFEQLYACLTISGMSHETLRWKLFPFSPDERAKQRYTHNVGKVKGDWEELRNRSCLAFFPISRIASLRQEIIKFQQKREGTHRCSLGQIFTPNILGPRLVCTKPCVVVTTFLVRSSQGIYPTTWYRRWRFVQP